MRKIFEEIYAYISTDEIVKAGTVILFLSSVIIRGLLYLLEHIFPESAGVINTISFTILYVFLAGFVPALWGYAITCYALRIHAERWNEIKERYAEMKKELAEAENETNI